LYLGVALTSLADVSVGFSRFAVDQRTAEVLAKQMERWTLLYTYQPPLPPSFIARGVIAGLGLADAPNRRHCVLQSVERFIIPIEGSSEAGTPGLKRYLRLGEERYEAIVQLAKANGLVTAEEGESRYAGAGKSRVYSSIYTQVLRAWDYRCALTGQRFGSVPGLHTGLEVVAIKPLIAGGPMHVRNFIPIAANLSQEWMKGAIAVGGNGELLVAFARLPQSLIGLIAQSNGFGSPVDSRYTPDPELLAWHKAYVLGS
jgi:hypothetical protein